MIQLGDRLLIPWGAGFYAGIVTEIDENTVVCDAVTPDDMGDGRQTFDLESLEQGIKADEIEREVL